MSATSSPLFGREAVALELNRQIEELLPVIRHDIKDLLQQKLSLGFLIYPLYARQQPKEMLSEEFLKKFDINIRGLEKMEASQKLAAFLKEQELKMIFDIFIEFTAQTTRKYIRLVIDGLEDA